MSEKNRVVVSNKDGVIWTQIFNKEGDDIISSFVSDNEIEALQKALKFLETDYWRKE